jgi:hypothetical protein
MYIHTTQVLIPHTCVCMGMHTHVRMGMYTYVCMGMYTYVCMDMYTYVRMYMIREWSNSTLGICRSPKCQQLLRNSTYIQNESHIYLFTYIC